MDSLVFPPARAAERTVVRASGLSVFGNCERMCAARYFRAEVEATGIKLRLPPVGVAARIGTAAHFGVSLTLGEKAATGQLAPMSAAIDAADQKFREEIIPGIQLDEVTPKAEIGRTQVRQIVSAYVTSIAPKVEPLWVETRIEATFSTDIMLSGQPDVVTPGQVRDLKTGRYRSSCGAQLGAYSLLARSQNLPIITLIEDHVPRTPIGQTQKRPTSYQHDMATSEHAAIGTLRHMQHRLDIFRYGGPGIMAGEPWAFTANPDSPLCSAKYCPAHSTEFCKEWKKK